MCEFHLQVTEDERISALGSALIARGITISNASESPRNIPCIINELKETRHYCQFSGGGDYLRLAGDATANPSMDTSNVNVSPQYEEEIGHIGVKATEASSQKALEYQLRANTIVGCLKNFLHLLENNKISEDLQKLDILPCYGIACTGAGSFCFIKLEVNLECMYFHYKVQMKNFASRNNTAALIDLSLGYIAGKKILF